MGESRRLRPAAGGSVVRIRAAEAGDVAVIEAIVAGAYECYVERIGMRPGPMDADYGEKVRRGLVSVAEDGDRAILGLIVLVEMPGHLLVENVAVEPERQGEGIGRALLAHAEDSAREAGLDTVKLYTHVKMTENRALYSRLGYREADRRSERGFERVFFHKHLPG
jgi:ribosomal protein S18 acetylase RimI-like enzyme